MTKGQIIYLPIVGWNTLFQRAQQLMTVAAKHGITVYHVNPHITSRKFRVSNTSTKNVYEILPETAAYPRRGMSILAAKKLAKQIASIVTTNHTQQTLIWVNAPYWNKVVQVLKTLLEDAPVVYDILDDFVSFDDLVPYKESLLRGHSQLIKTSTIISYTAKNLLRVYPAIKSNRSIYLPNGVNVNEWSISEPPKDNILVGFFGSFAFWADVKPIYMLLSKQVPVEIIGPISNSNLYATPNLRVLPAISHNELSVHASKWSCGIIPFLKLSLTDCTDPVKLYEYMALGLPVVASELSELQLIASTMNEYIRPTLVPCGQPEAFADAVLKAVNSDTIEKRLARREWASKQSWESRMTTMLTTLGLEAWYDNTARRRY